MAKIKPSALRACRDRKGWSQQKLSENSGIDKGTISRLERGANSRVRGRTLEQLSEQLGVRSEVLTGLEPIPDQESKPRESIGESQMNIRILDSARNALALVASRYGVRQTHIVELAPLLFMHAVEQCLKLRATRAEEFEQRLTEVQRLRRNFPHLSGSIVNFFESEEMLEAEKESIEAREIFLGERPCAIQRDYLQQNYDDSADSPFVKFLTEMAKEIGGEFEGWFESPYFKICQSEALDLAGADVAAAEEILVGRAPIHEMPKELRAPERIGDRIQWILDRGEDSLKKTEEALDSISVEQLENSLRTNDQ